MPAPSPFDYAIVRVVPNVEREEFVNVGVILFCRTRRFLDTRIKLDMQRLAALFSKLDVRMVQAQLDLILRICAGGSDAGPLGELSQAERFHWLVSPRSTTIQISPVHCGLCVDPQAALDNLFEKLVY
ncbi:MAG: DUF3037 domain-containing protein [Anaerolineae bacterium]|jgi:hypothetical protein